MLIHAYLESAHTTSIDYTASSNCLAGVVQPTHSAIPSPGLVTYTTAEGITKSVPTRSVTCGSWWSRRLVADHRTSKSSAEGNLSAKAHPLGNIVNMHIDVKYFYVRIWAFLIPLDIYWRVEHDIGICGVKQNYSPNSLFTEGSCI